MQLLTIFSSNILRLLEICQVLDFSNCEKCLNCWKFCTLTLRRTPPTNIPQPIRMHVTANNLLLQHFAIAGNFPSVRLCQLLEMSQLLEVLHSNFDTTNIAGPYLLACKCEKNIIHFSIATHFPAVRNFLTARISSYAG